MFINYWSLSYPFRSLIYARFSNTWNIYKVLHKNIPNCVRYCNHICNGIILSLSNKCITQTTICPKLWGPFSSLANCFLLFCSDLAVFKFLTLLADIQTPNWRTEKRTHPIALLEFHIVRVPQFFYFNVLSFRLN